MLPLTLTYLDSSLRCRTCGGGCDFGRGRECGRDCGRGVAGKNTPPITLA